MDNVLVVDDERNIRTLVARVLAPDQIEVQGAGTGSEGIQMADEMSPDLVLLDLRLPDMDGMDVLRTLKNRHPGVAVIIITGFGQIQSAVEAIKVGATDYIEKPFEHLEKLKLAVSRALDEIRAKREIRRLHGLQEKQYGVDQLIGDSESTRNLRDLIRKVARSEAQTILIQGDSGTGKELVARGLHYESARRDFPFMEVNCAAITESNVRSHKSIKGFTPETERLLLNYPWPGNVRELRNLIERLVILGNSESIEPQHLPLQFAAQVVELPRQEGPQELRTLAEVERAYINQ